MSLVDVGSGTTRRRFDVGPDGVRAVALVVAGRTVPLEDQGPRLLADGRIVDARELALAGSPDVAADGSRLAWRLVGRGLDVQIAVEAGAGHGVRAAQAGAPVVRTRFSVGGTDVGRLERVEVERWAGMEGARVRGPAAVEDPVQLGQPVFGDGFFAGLEHPGAENVATADGSVSFGLPVDVDLAGGRWSAPTVVVGGAAVGEELSAFWDELDRIRASPPRTVVLANNWYQLGAIGRMDEATVAAELEGFGRVADRHGLVLDWYCLDDPWDGEWSSETGIWGRLAPGRFPGATDGLQRAAEGRVGGVGLWVSPWGGYFDRHEARAAWGREHGYEIDDRGGTWPCLCPAGDKYRRHLAESLGAFTTAGVGYWKLDGVQFDCRGPGHGHAVGPGGRTDQMDRFAALLDGVRAVRPDVFLTFTTGSNPSPWWLRHADFVWRGGLDDDAPAGYDGGRHERFATYIDSCLDGFRPTALPVSSIVTFSVVENAVSAYRQTDQDAGGGQDAWERHCWFLAGRGTLHHDLYVAPDSLSEREWEALARALGWARRHQGVLARSRMVGGRPQAGEPYGFVSVAGGEAIVCLRNPSTRGQPVALTAADLGGGDVTDAHAVWGRTATVRPEEPIELEPFEVVLVSGRWRPGRRPGPPG